MAHVEEGPRGLETGEFMNSLLLDFHSIISVWAPDLPSAIQRPLRAHFQPFLRESGASSATADIMVLPMPENFGSGVIHREFNALFGCALCFHAEEPAVVLLHRGQPDISMTLDDTIKIHCRFRPGIGQRLYGVVLLAIYLAARVKGRLILHGVVVERDGHGMFICGHRGVRKTQLLLTFLEHGWSYVSDDKFLLDGSQACLIEPLVAINSHHYQVFPWLEQRLPRSAGHRILSRFVDPLRSLVTSHAPTRLQTPLQRRLDPFRRESIEAIMPGSKISPRVKLKDGFILLRGERFAIQPQPPELASSRLESIHQMMHLDVSAMEQLLLLYSGRTLPAVKAVIAKSLADVNVYSMTLPDTLNPDEVYNALAKFHADI